MAQNLIHERMKIFEMLVAAQEHVGGLNMLARRQIGRHVANNEYASEGKPGSFPYSDNRSSMFCTAGTFRTS